MTRPIDALFSGPDDTDEAAAKSALADHESAMKAWLASSPHDRPHHWRAVEAAWRRVKQLGVADQAQHAARTHFQHSGKLRSIQ